MPVCRSAAITAVTCALVLLSMPASAQPGPTMLGTWVRDDDITQGYVIEANDRATCVVEELNLASGEVTATDVLVGHGAVLTCSDLGMSVRLAHVVKEDWLISEIVQYRNEIGTTAGFLSVRRSRYTYHRAGPNAQDEAKAELKRREAQQQAPQ